MEPYVTSDVAMLKGYIPQNCESVMSLLVVPVFISLLFLSCLKLVPAYTYIKLARVTAVKVLCCPCNLTSGTTYYSEA